MSNSYLGFTIGPVIKTIQKVRHTRELWGASYLFSYLVKRIVAELRKDTNRQFVMPFTTPGEADAFYKSCKQHEAQKHKKGAGLFPDRFIFQCAGDDDLEVTQGVVENVIDTLAGEVAGFLHRDVKAVQDYFRQYIHYHLITVKLSDGENPILKLTPLLDSVELQTQFPVQHQTHLEDFLDRIPRSFLVYEAFGKSKSFHTLLEVAAYEFKDDESYRSVRQGRMDRLLQVKKSKQEEDEADEEDDRALMQQLADKYGRQFRQAHKYIAVVHADGDRVGEIIKQLTADAFQGFSHTLKSYALEAVGLIDAYGGVNVYAGGDDLLFFAPFVNGGDNIFLLCNRLNKKFSEYFSKAGSIVPTLSFGVAISYYKYPLSETLNLSRKLLFNVAKKKPGKNCLAFEVIKHSGAAFGASLNLGSVTYQHFGSLMRKNNDFLQQPEAAGSRMLSSITYRIAETEVVYRLIGSDREAIGNFIDNCFDEAVHVGEKKGYLDDVKELVASVFQEPSCAEGPIEQIYGLLRTVQFVG